MSPRFAMSPLLRAVLAAGLALAAGAAMARPFTVADLLKVESLDGAYLAPGGRWLVVQRVAPYDTATAYGTDGFEFMALGRLDLIDLEGDETPSPLDAEATEGGLNAGPFSPDGRKMALFRLRGHNWELGVADLASRHITWLGLVVEPASWGRTAQWRSADELVVVAVTDGDQPNRFNRQWSTKIRPPQLWAAANAGETPTDTVVGSGRFLDLTPKGPRTALVRVDVTERRTQVLARGTFIDLEISPNGHWIAALGEEAHLQPKASDWINTATTARRRGLTVVDLTSGALSRPCKDLDLATHLLSWSTTGDRLLVFGRDEGNDWTVGSLHMVNAPASRCTVIPTPGFKPSLNQDPMNGFPVVRGDWMGEDPIVLGKTVDAQGSVRQDWRRLTSQGAVNLTAKLPAAPQSLLALSPRSLLFATPAGLVGIDREGAVTHLAEGPIRPIAQPGPGVGDRLAYVASRQGFAWVVDGGEVARVTADGLGEVRSLPAGAQPLLATSDLVVAETTNAHGVLSLVALHPDRSRLLEAVNLAYGEISFSEPREIAYRGAEGEALKAWLYPPPDPAPGAKAPLVVIPYPGSVYPTPPRVFSPGFAFPEQNPHILTAAGYAVLVPSMPRDWSSHEPAQGLADQVLAAVDAAVVTGGIDPDRVALWGHSFGGYAALAIASQTHRFRSVIEAAGKTDLISAYGPFLPPARSAPEDGISPLATMGWMENGQGNLGVAPAQDIARYARNSPAFQADRITAPVLMFHGDMDFVPLAQGEEMFSALYRQHKDAVLVTFWGEGHLTTSPANIRRMYDCFLWWLGRTLGDGATLRPAEPPTIAGPTPR